MALRIEAWTTPKPGLVDRENSGAHRDMDYPLFLASCGALRDYFSVCARIGGGKRTTKESGCFFRLRRAGLEGEKKMFTVTGGVNTHKGAVFSIGILSFCMGQLSAEKGGIPATKDRHVFLAELRRRCAKISPRCSRQIQPCILTENKYMKKQVPEVSVQKHFQDLPAHFLSDIPLSGLPEGKGIR